jgi:hypothetical protein
MNFQPHHAVIRRLGKRVSSEEVRGAFIAFALKEVLDRFCPTRSSRAALLLWRKYVLETKTSLCHNLVLEQCSATFFCTHCTPSFNNGS